MIVREYISESEIARRVAEVAREIENAIGNDEAVFVANLKGSVVFFSDLIRRIGSRRISLDFVSTESYAGTQTTGVVKITRDLSLPVGGKRVVLVEDIVDTGLTLAKLVKYIQERHHPAEIRVCALLDKPSRRKTEVTVDHTGFRVENAFLVGYGMDHEERYRNLPYIGVLIEETEQVPEP